MPKKFGFDDLLFLNQPEMSKYFQGNKADLTKQILELIYAVSDISLAGDDYIILEDKEIPLEGMSLSPVQLRFLQVIIKISRAQRVLEIGSFVGVSALYMGAAVPDGGSVVSIEKFDRFAAIAEKNIEVNNMSGVVEILCGDALAVMADMKKQEFDFIFVDGDKDHYIDYFKICDESLLSQKGLMIFDDVFFQGDTLNYSPSTPKGKGVKLFLEEIMKIETYDKLFLPIENGMLFLVRK